MAEKRYGVAIIGGSGYGAGELLRLLLAHPHLEVCCMTSRSHAGQNVASVHSHLEGLTSLTFSDQVDLPRLRRYSQSAIVLAMPSGHAIPTLRALLNEGLPASVTVLDLSGDLRLKDPATHTAFYPEVAFDHELHKRFFYGLPELKTASSTKPGCTPTFISNPGCLATASILALAPLAEIGGKGAVVVDAKTGTSGAGRDPQSAMHHPSRCGDFTAYKVLQHRHEPEILQALGESFSQNFSFMFVPHLLPVSRGIYVTAYISLSTAADALTLSKRFDTFYAEQPFVRVRRTIPRLVDVIGTNFCDVHVAVRQSQVVVLAAIDNLGKGMAGQAIQNLNIAFGVPQDSGLRLAALGPV
jgi:N-acetyl-gamma-glutamyl-phosphate reductase